MIAIKSLVIKHQQTCGVGRMNKKIDRAVMADCEYKLNEKYRDYVDEINQADGYVIVTYNEDGNRVEQCEVFKFPPHLLTIVNQPLSSCGQPPAVTFVRPLVIFAASV